MTTIYNKRKKKESKLWILFLGLLLKENLREASSINDDDYDDPGCQGLTNKKSTSTIQLLVPL